MAAATNKVYKSNTARGNYLILTLDLVSQNIPNNTSILSFKLELKAGSTSYGAEPVVANVTIGGMVRWQVYNTPVSGPHPGLTKVLAQGTLLVTHFVDTGTLGVTAAANFRTVAQDQPWSVPQLRMEVLYSVKPIPQYPNAPAGVPTISENLSTREITVTAPTAVKNASAITGYQIRWKDDYKNLGKDPGGGANRDKDKNWITQSTNSSRQWKFTPPKPITKFYFKARALSRGGPGPWTTSYSTITSTGSGPAVRVNGVWKNTNAYVKEQGIWKPVLCYARHVGRWKVMGR